MISILWLIAELLASCEPQQHPRQQRQNYCSDCQRQIRTNKVYWTLVANGWIASMHLQTIEKKMHTYKKLQMLLIVIWCVGYERVFETVGPSKYCWLYISWSQKKQVTDSGEFVTEINCPKSLLHRLYRLSDNEGSLNRQHADKCWKYSH